ncbi:MAG: EamA family transporter [Candidatus Micrarchaeota archaeon]|nr:EamA family transporter [Candidatus Micrarchaeota archaeon]
MEWMWLAAAAMVFLALSNVVLKILVGKAGEAKMSMGDVLPMAGIVVLVILGVVAFLVITGKINADLVKWAVVFVAFSTTAFFGVVLALRDGKVSVVTALMGLSTVLVAVLSYFFLGERLSAKEFAAIILAVASVLALAL